MNDYARTLKDIARRCATGSRQLELGVAAIAPLARWDSRSGIATVDCGDFLLQVVPSW